MVFGHSCDEAVLCTISVWTDVVSIQGITLVFHCSSMIQNASATVVECWHWTVVCTEESLMQKEKRLMTGASGAQCQKKLGPGHGRKVPVLERKTHRRTIIYCKCLMTGWSKSSKNPLDLWLQFWPDWHGIVL